MANAPPKLSALLLLLAGFLVLCSPLVLFVWHELSELLMGRIHPLPLAAAAVLFGVLTWLVARFGRKLTQFDAGL